MQGDASGGASQGSGVEHPTIIVKKVSGHGGHHGGAWKVAFADFVTAMMALFLVLWLMNASEKEKEAIASYFTDPKGVGEKLGSGQAGSGGGLSVGQNELEGLADKIQQAMKAMPQFETLKEQVAMTVTGEGLRIELLETEKGMFFESGSAAPSPSGHAALTLIASELAKLPNNLIIEGHTDSRPFRSRMDYSNWELSADRANSVRRILLESNLPAGRVVEVRGFADRQLRKPETPEDPSNRRISLIVKYLDESSGETYSPGSALQTTGAQETISPPSTAQPGPRSEKPAQQAERKSEH